MTLGTVCWLLGPALMCAGWQQARHAAGTRWRWDRSPAVDAILPALVFLTLLVLSARPLFAGAVGLAMGLGWARADHDKRRVLREPIVFSDIFQALDMLRHPRLALPFPNTRAVATLALVAVSFFVLLALWEPPAWQGLPGLPAMAVGVAYLLVVLVRKLSLRDLRSTLSLDPARDSARHGPFATILLHALFAGRERAKRQRACAQTPVTTITTSQMAPPAGAVVLIQSESFFDLRRLHPAVPRDLLPNFSRLCHQARQWGRLKVPSWGANTVRTEFAVLSGLPAVVLGFDRFNPYHRFVSQPIRSLAWTLRAEGYHTVCVHPFDRRFYRRDQAMPLLGFDEFIGEEQFAEAQRINGFVADSAVAELATRLIHEHGPKLFLFVVTMENHGPWSGMAGAEPDGLPDLGLAAQDRLALARYTSSLVNADRMLGRLSDELSRQTRPAVLGFYGDHLPSLPGVFSSLQLDDAKSDYLVWNSLNRRLHPPQDLAAEDLATAVLNARRTELALVATTASPRVA